MGDVDRQWNEQESRRSGAQETCPRRTVRRAGLLRRPRHDRIGSIHEPTRTTRVGSCIDPSPAERAAKRRPPNRRALAGHVCGW